MSFQNYSNSAKSKLFLGNISTKAMVGAACCVFLIVALIVVGLAFNGQTEGLSIRSSKGETSAESAEVTSSSPDIVVHIGGHVVNPGICKIPAGSRISDVVIAAGGFTDDADPDAVNLAREVQDGEQIIIPSSIVQDETSRQDTGLSQEANSNDKVNINTASSDELQTISGIGASKAQKIIDYRKKNGPFKSISELTNVSGIGEKTLESIKNDICV